MDVEFSVSEFVAVLNQTLEFAYLDVAVVGELANFRVSKNRWVYFDLKDELATVRFFGTVYHMPGPLEDGMLLKVRARPQLHPQYGFSMNVASIQPSGEGSIKKAANLLEAKLTSEGLFDPARKRPLPCPPERVGLITSAESAAYTDFVKVLNARWRGVEIELIDVQVQGEQAAAQIIRALERFNELAVPPEVLVLTRGGGSAEDLAVFSTEQVTRAVAASRIPTLVAIGHERDISLSEMAADQRASTPSNAAELLTPDRQHILANIKSIYKALQTEVLEALQTSIASISQKTAELETALGQIYKTQEQNLKLRTQLLNLLDPAAPLTRGYALVYQSGKPVKTSTKLTEGEDIEVRLLKRSLNAKIISIKESK